MPPHGKPSSLLAPLIYRHSVKASSPGRRGRQQVGATPSADAVSELNCYLLPGYTTTTTPLISTTTLTTTDLTTTSYTTTGITTTIDPLATGLNQRRSDRSVTIINSIVGKAFSALYSADPTFVLQQCKALVPPATTTFTTQITQTASTLTTQTVTQHATSTATATVTQVVQTVQVCFTCPAIDASSITNGYGIGIINGYQFTLDPTTSFPYCGYQRSMDNKGYAADINSAPCTKNAAGGCQFDVSSFDALAWDSVQSLTRFCLPSGSQSPVHWLLTMTVGRVHCKLSACRVRQVEKARDADCGIATPTSGQVVLLS